MCFTLLPMSQRITQWYHSTLTGDTKIGGNAICFDWFSLYSLASQSRNHVRSVGRYLIENKGKLVTKLIPLLSCRHVCAHIVGKAFEPEDKFSFVHINSRVGSLGRNREYHVKVAELVDSN